MAKDDDEELRVVEDGHEEGGETVQLDDGAEAKGDERVAQDEDDDGDDSAATEAIRAQRRIERKAKKERERTARDRTFKELNLLRARNEVLERRQSQIDARQAQLEQRTFQSEWHSIDSDLQKLEQSLQEADRVIAQGIRDQDGNTVAEAQNIKDEIRRAKDRLLQNKQIVAENARQAQEQAVQQQRQQAQPPQQQVAPEVVAHADRWRAQNPWFKGGTADEDSEIVTMLDRRLMSEGMDPATQEYWEELNDRVKARLPHHFGANGAANGAGNGSSERRGPAMANGGRERQLRSGEMYVSKERKEALIQAGVWDDPKLRTKYLKRYAEYDEAARRDA